MAIAAAEASRVPATTPLMLTTASTAKSRTSVDARATGSPSTGSIVLNESTSAAATAAQAKTTASQVSSPARNPGYLPNARSTYA